MLKYIKDDAHFSEVLSLVTSAKYGVWIGTSDMKDLYFKKGRKVVPFLEILDTMIKRGIEVRLIHAKEPGENFKNDFDKYPMLFSGLKRKLCPRVHFKLIIIDDDLVYIGSANLTGAAMGIKSSTKRNFEAGILTDEFELITAAQEHYLSVWNGDHCSKCDRAEFCGDKIRY